MKGGILDGRCSGSLWAQHQGLQQTKVYLTNDAASKYPTCKEQKPSLSLWYSGKWTKLVLISLEGPKVHLYGGIATYSRYVLTFTALRVLANTTA